MWVRTGRSQETHALGPSPTLVILGGQQPLPVGAGGGEMLRMQDPLAPPHSWSLFYCFQLEKKDMQII